MRGGERESVDQVTAGRRMFVFLALISVSISLAAVLAFDRSSATSSLLDLTNLVGPTTDSLLHGRGLTACTVLMGTPGNPICFHGGRMPVPTLTIALGVRLLGDHFMRVAVLKTLLLLVPLEIAIFLVCGPLESIGAGWRRWFASLLLLAPFGITAFLADVVNLQVEEGYSYSFLTLSMAVVLFRGTRHGWLRRDGVGEAVVFGVAVAGLYLSKSSMAPVAAVLTVAYVLRARGTTIRLVAAVLAVAAPLGWAVYQHHATGRYSLGTSIDGLNLHKGNDAGFLLHYPPTPGNTLDGFDADLNAGMHFPDEWSFNDFHQRAAMMFIRSHPEATALGDLRKIEMIFFSVRKVGSGSSHGTLLAVELAGMVVFRVIFWTAMVISSVAVVRGSLLRGYGSVFLLVVGAVALPYVLGFAYTRHVSVLIYPSVLLCCRALADGRREQAGGKGLH